MGRRRDLRNEKRRGDRRDSNAKTADESGDDE